MLKLEYQPDPQGGPWKEVWTLPQNWTLSPAKIEEITVYLKALEALCAQTPINETKYRTQTSKIVSRLMASGLKSASQNEMTVVIRCESFMDALDDVASWAVKAACLGWLKMKYGEGLDYEWIPTPPALRKCALIEIARRRGPAEKLKWLLSAKPALEVDENSQRVFGDQLQALIRSLKATNVVR
jgi:hypothetical protein